jgi:hypothetical protein
MLQEQRIADGKIARLVGAASDEYIPNNKRLITPLTGATDTMVDHDRVLIVKPAGTIAALTVVTPANPFDGQELILSFSQIVTALTMTIGGGKSMVGALTAAAVGTSKRWVYNASDTTWYPA